MMFKKLIIFFLMVILLACSVTAWEWDNTKTFIDDGSKYGKIRIDNALGLGDTIAEYSLTKNTDTCFINCEASGTVTLYSKDTIFTEFEFMDISQKNAIDIKGYDIEVTQEIIKPIYRTECDTKEIVFENESKSTERVNCSEVFVRNSSYTKFVPYNFQELEPGTYSWKLKGRKEAGTSVDWIAYSLGNRLTEWATWNKTSCNSRIQINVTNNHAYELNEFDYNFSLDTTMWLNTGVYILENFTGFLKEREVWNETAYGSATTTLWTRLNMTASEPNHILYAYYNCGSDIVRDEKNETWTYSYGFDESYADCANDPHLNIYDGGGGGDCSNGLGATDDTNTYAWFPAISNYNFTALNVTEYMLMADVNTTTTDTGSYIRVRTYNRADERDKSYSLKIGSGNMQFNNRYDGVYPDLGGGCTLTAGQFYHTVVTAHSIDEPNIYVSINASSCGAVSYFNNTGTTLGSGEPSIGYGGGAIGEATGVDNIEVIQYLGAANQPTYVVGDEENFTEPTNNLPVIGVLNCSDGTEWKTSFDYLDNIEYCQTTCTDADGNATSVDYIIITPITTYSGLTNSTVSNYSSYDVNNITFNNALGYWNISASCSDTVNSSNTSIQWYIDPFAPLIYNINYSSIVTSESIPTNNVSINWSVIDNSTITTFISYNGTNFTAIGTNPNYGYNISLVAANNNTLIIYANDSYGNLNHSILDIYVKTYPNIEKIGNISFSNPFYYSLALNLTNNLSDLNDDTSDLGLSYELSNTSYFDLDINNATKIMNITQISAGSDIVRINLTVIDTDGLTNTTNFEISFKEFNISLCTNTTGDNVILFNISMYDESNLTIIAANSTLDMTFLVWQDDKSINYTTSYSIERTNESQYVCFAPNGSYAYTDAMIVYNHDGYTQREYYFINKLLNITSSSLEKVKLYLLALSKSTGITFNILDETEQPLSEIYILVQKYDVGTNTFNLVAMGKSSDIGEDYIYLNLYESIYKFILKDYDEIVFTSQNQKVSSTTLYFTLTEATIADYLESFANVAIGSITFNNATNTFSVTYSTLDSSVTNVCLEVMRYSSEHGSGVACKNCATSASATINCPVERLNGEYQASVLVGITKSPETFRKAKDYIYIISDGVDELYTLMNKSDGLFMAFFLLLTLGTLSAFYPMLGGMLTLFGVIALSALGIIHIGYGLIIVAVIILIIAVSRSKN